MAGPPHNGWLVDVGICIGITRPLEPAGSVEVMAGLGTEACPTDVGDREEKDIGEGVNVGKFRLGPSGLFH